MQLPQCATSDRVSTQASSSAQKVGFDAGQVHWPPAQTPPSRVHGVVQLPQCWTSVWGSMHAGLPPQSMAGATHAQAPASQVPSPQARPHAPQWSAFVCGSTQVLAHTRWPAGQASHTPAVHTSSAPQTWPQAPQLSRSVATVRQKPPHVSSPVRQRRGSGQPVEAKPNATRARKGRRLRWSVVRTRRQPSAAVTTRASGRPAPRPPRGHGQRLVSCETSRTAPRAAEVVIAA